MTIIWVFNGQGSAFPGGVFAQLEPAERWIAKHQLTGILTAYPLDTGVYDWVIEQGTFTPKSEWQRTPGFIQGFSSAYQEHYHYAAGRRV